MAGEQIFIVEDERIVAEDLKRILGRLGYQVVGSAASGDEAIKKMEEKKPHLVLMDIRIKGSLDGIDVAEQVVAQFDVPVVYLTAYADETTLDRAKGTLAAGYILKPFEERGLKTTIELALYRHTVERMLKNVDEWHGRILENLELAVMAMDTKGNVVYMNKTAESLTGHSIDESFGKPLQDFVLSHLDRNESPIKDMEGNDVGTAFILTESNSTDLGRLGLPRIRMRARLWGFMPLP